MPTLVKTIRYNRGDRDFSWYINDVFCGCTATLRQAQTNADDYVYEALRRGNVDAADLSAADAADVYSALYAA